MDRKNIFLVFVVIFGLVSSLGCSDSDDNSETAIEAEDIQTGEAKAAQEEEPAPSGTEETEVIIETPVSEDTEETDIVSLEEAKTEEEMPEEKEEDLDEEYRARLAEQDDTEEESEEESVTSSISSDDLVWIDVMLDDLADVQEDMNGVSRAAQSNHIASLTVYTDNLYTSTGIAIDHCDKYDVSADLQPVEDEYRLAMVAYNWAAVYCYAGIEAYNAGNAAEATASFNDAAEFINSGTEHTLEATELMNEYNENHGI